MAGKGYSTDRAGVTGRTREERTGRYFRHPGDPATWLGLLVLAFLMIFPLIYMISTALKRAGDVFNGALIPSHPDVGNFGYVLGHFPLLKYMFTTLIVAVAITVGSLFLHSMAGYALARLDFPGRKLIFGGVTASLLVSLPVILVPLFLVTKYLHFVNSYLGLIVPAIFNGFGIFFLRQFYISLPSELEDAAEVDGSGYWGIYWHVALPLSKAFLGALGVFIFLASWNAFLWPLTVVNDPNLTMVQVGIASFRGEYAGAWNYTMAASTIAALPTLVLFFGFQRRLSDSVKLTGGK